jgi:hypothetical protein
MKFLKICTIATVVLLLGAGIASSQTWTPLNHQPGVNLGVMLQLRDGRILAHEEQNGNPRNWWILTPDSTGSYVNGTWSSGGQLPSNYAPFYFSSQVLLDGKRVIIEGGEYNFGQAVWTNLGAILDISTLTWAANGHPDGWGNIGDAQSVILANGKYMQADCCTTQQYLGAAGPPWTWTGATGTGKADVNDEEGWTLLPSGKVLTVDAYVFNTNTCGGNKASELYDPGTGAWTCGPNTPVQMWDNAGHELGPAVLMYNAKVLQFGAIPATAIYDPVANSWTAGPTPAGGLDAADAPAALEPNGKVLAMLSPGEFQAGCQMVEYDPTANTITNTTNPTNCPSDSSFVGHLMVLPTGQIMFTDFSGLVEIYTPAAGVGTANVPLIIGPMVNSPMLPTNNVVKGFNFNGLTQNNAYGDDYQGDTDYPLVRLTSYSTGLVYYGITHDESTHSIAPGGLMSTMFDRPAGLPAGFYKLEVIANGVKSSNFVVWHN